MLLSPIIAEELAQPYCPSKCRPLQLEWKTGIPKFHLEIMAFNLHNVSWWVYCLYTYSLFVLSFLYSLSTLSLYLTSLSILSNIKYGTIHLGHSQLGDQNLSTEGGGVKNCLKFANVLNGSPIS